MSVNVVKIEILLKSQTHNEPTKFLIRKLEQRIIIGSETLNLKAEKLMDVRCLELQT